MRRSEPARRRPAQGTTHAQSTPWRALLGVLCGLAATVLAQNAQASTIEGINHTHWAINHFSVDGRSGIDIIGPYQGGGGGCCYIAPARWQPGMTVRVDWETGAGIQMVFPALLIGPSIWPGRKNRCAKTPAQQSGTGAGLHRPESLRHHRALPALR